MAPLARSILGLLVGRAFSSETCTASDVCAEDATLLQTRNRLKDIARYTGGTGLPGAAEYLGCFVDDGNRDLEQGPRWYGYTTTSCAAACSDFTYFALQNNGWCACSNAYSTAPQYSRANDDDCGGPCAGESTGRCGGFWRNAVYRTNGGPPYVLEQGLCRDNAFHGGWCSCGTPASAEECWGEAAGWPSLRSVEYRTSNRQCALLHYQNTPPTDCPAGCSAVNGNGANVLSWQTLSYHGDGNADNVCMLPTDEPTPTPYVTEQGLCRENGVHGGWCSCGTPPSAAGCWGFSADAMWPSLKAVEYRTSNRQCALLYYQSDAPADCPTGCTPGGSGNGGSVLGPYHGDGNSDNVCLLPVDN